MKENNKAALAMDKRTYTTLTYANGPGYQGNLMQMPLIQDLFLPNLTEAKRRANITEKESSKCCYTVVLLVYINMCGNRCVKLQIKGAVIHPEMTEPYKANFLFYQVRHSTSSNPQSP